jgi:hypothetical protein
MNIKIRYNQSTEKEETKYEQTYPANGEFLLNIDCILLVGSPGLCYR